MYIYTLYIIVSMINDICVSIKMRFQRTRRNLKRPCHGYLNLSFRYLHCVEMDIGTLPGHLWWCQWVASTQGHMWRCQCVTSTRGHLWWRQCVALTRGHLWWCQSQRSRLGIPAPTSRFVTYVKPVTSQAACSEGVPARSGISALGYPPTRLSRDNPEWVLLEVENSWRLKARQFPVPPEWWRTQRYGSTFSLLYRCKLKAGPSAVVEQVEGSFTREILIPCEWKSL